MRNIKSLGLYKKEYKLENDKLLKKLIEIPFLYYDNNNIIEDIFDEFINNNNSNKVYIQLLNNFKTYFIKEWTNYFIDGHLNYNLITKIQRSNSFIENYNKRINSNLRPFLNKKGYTHLPWPLFIGFIKDEEDYFKKLVINLLKSTKICNRKIVIKNKIRNINDIYNSKIKFFIYDRYSCRLDCFFAIFFFNIMHAINILDHSYNNTNNIDNIIKFVNI